VFLACVYVSVLELRDIATGLVFELKFSRVFFKFVTPRDLAGEVVSVISEMSLTKFGQEASVLKKVVWVLFELIPPESSAVVSGGPGGSGGPGDEWWAHTGPTQLFRQRPVLGGIEPEFHRHFTARNF
jgi:hypothetical protein